MLTVKYSLALYGDLLRVTKTIPERLLHTQEAKPATISKIERHISECPNKSCAAL